MPEAFILDGLRTPIGRYGGVLADQRPDDLVATTLKAVVERSGIDASDIDEVILGLFVELNGETLKGEQPLVDIELAVGVELHGSAEPLLRTTQLTTAFEQVGIGIADASLGSLGPPARRDRGLQQTKCLVALAQIFTGTGFDKNGLDAQCRLDVGAAGFLQRLEGSLRLAGRPFTVSDDGQIVRITAHAVEGTVFSQRRWVFTSCVGSLGGSFPDRRQSSGSTTCSHRVLERQSRIFVDERTSGSQMAGDNGRQLLGQTT